MTDSNANALFHVLDDARKPVPVITNASASELADDPELRDVLLRLRANDSLLAWQTPVGLLSVAIVIAVCIFVQSWTLTAMLSVFAVATGFRLHARRASSSRYVGGPMAGAVRTLLAAGRCASCGYRLADVAANAETGLVTCPECGARWSNSLLFRGRAHTGPATFDHRGKPAFVSDASGVLRRIADLDRLPTDDPRFATIILPAIRSRQKDMASVARWQGVVFIGIAAMQLFAMWTAIQSGLSWGWSLVAALGIGYTAFVTVRRGFHSRKLMDAKPTAELLIACDRCPSCMTYLEPTESDVRVCSTCKGTWREKVT